MGLTASGGLGGPHRFQARRPEPRPSRARTGLLGLLLAAVLVAGFGVSQIPAAAPAAPPEPVAAAVAATTVALGGPALATAAAPTGATAALEPRSAIQGVPAGPLDIAPRAPLAGGFGHGSVDPADPVPGTTPDPAEADLERAAHGIGGLLGLRGWIDTTPASPAAPIRPPSAEPEDLTGYVWPLRGARITGWFADSDEGFIVLRGKRIHDGLDLATFCGHAVLAAHRGTVLYAGRAFHAFLGFDGPLDAFYDHLRAGGDWMSLPRVVVIDDGNGYHSAYVHLGSHSVKPGDVVKAGQVIGKEGATGRASGCHLHYMLIRMDGQWVPVAPKLVRKWKYPAMVRERIDPMRVLSVKLKGAARRLPGVNPPKEPFRYVPPRAPVVRRDVPR